MAWGISSFTVQEAMYDAVLEFDGQDASLVEDNLCHDGAQELMDGGCADMEGEVQPLDWLI